jgi:DNA-binding MarR family transcriptional regulator
LTAERPDDLAARIVAALDRLANARRVQRQSFATARGLTLLQLELLATVAGGPPPQPLVGTLADEIGVSQPTVTDSVRALERKGLVRRTPDPQDARRVRIALTDDGTRLAAEYADLDEAFVRAVEQLPGHTQEEAFAALLGVITALVDDGTITVARTCATCHFHRHDGMSHHCTLLGADLPARALQVNCAEHRSV